MLAICITVVNLRTIVPCSAQASLKVLGSSDLLPQPPEQLELHAHVTTLSLWRLFNTIQSHCSMFNKSSLYEFNAVTRARLKTSLNI
jgi:hypothetical protein